MHALVRCFLTLLAVVSLTVTPQAQGFPSHTVKFLVPFPPGGINDVLARIIGDKLSAKWGQPIIVENKTGAGGNIGADFVAQQPPDGYTINQTLYKHLTYKPEDFVPLTVVGAVPNIAIVRKDLPVNTLAELTDYVKKNPGKVVFGSQGNGATPHLTANLFMTMSGSQMVHVPYNGSPSALLDVIGGHVQLMFADRHCR